MKVTHLSRSLSQIEGIYLGSQEVQGTDGMCPIHCFETETGDIAVWGFGALNRLLARVPIGRRITVEYHGKKPKRYQGKMRKCRSASVWYDDGQAS